MLSVRQDNPQPSSIGGDLDLVLGKVVREPASCYYAGFTQDGTPIGITVSTTAPKMAACLRFVITLAAVFGFVVSRGRTF